MQKDSDTVKDKNCKDSTTFLDYLTTTAVDITHRVAGLDLAPSEMPPLAPDQVLSLSIKTTGDFQIVLVLCAQREVLEEITKHMKRQSDVTLGDLEIYGGEYFNILCGCFISRLNNSFHAKTRFHIPHITQGFYTAKRNGHGNKCASVAFSCPYGALEFYIYELEASADTCA